MSKRRLYGAAFVLFYRGGWLFRPFDVPKRGMQFLPEVVVPHPHVEVRRDVLGGSPIVKGSRVPVRRLWSWHRGGTSVETLIKRYPALGPARIFDALAFAYDNQEIVEADLTRERALLGPDAEKIPGAMNQTTLTFPKKE